METLKEHFKFAEDTFLKDGYLSPMLYIKDEHGNNVVIGLELQKDSIIKRQMFYFAGQKVAKIGLNPDWVVFVTEMWFKNCDKDEVPVGYISDMPDKKEGLICVYQEKTGKSTGMIKEIIRDGDKVSLGEEQKGLNNISSGVLDEFWKGYIKTLKVVL
ncbi:MAG TPA: hypothetical protein VGB37_13050 [Candidatus Lokiarchaeia archaeon]